MRAFGFARVLNEVSGGNSTTTPLSGAATFTGAWEDVTVYGGVTVAVLTDVAGTLYIEFSPDGTNADSSIPLSISANTNEVHRFTVTRRFFRIRIVNGSASQAFLRAQVIYGDKQPLTSALNSLIQLDADAMVVRTLDTEALLAAGYISGISVVNKFGRNLDVDTGTVPEDIWGGGGVYTGFPDSALETISVSSDSASDTSNGTGARTVRLTGLDTDYNIVSADVTLNGITPVATTQTFRRVHTAQVLTAGSGGVNVGIITFNHTTTTANVFLQMMPGRNQTNNSAYTIPAGKTGFIRRIFASTLSTSAGAADCAIWTRAFGGVYRQRRPFSVSNTTNWIDDIYAGIAFTEKSDIILRCISASANNMNIAAGYDMILVDNA